MIYYRYPLDNKYFSMVLKCPDRIRIRPDLLLILLACWIRIRNSGLRIYVSADSDPEKDLRIHNTDFKGGKV
jgi:hypothetical protein